MSFFNRDVNYVPITLRKNYLQDWCALDLSTTKAIITKQGSIIYFKNYTSLVGDLSKSMSAYFTFLTEK